MIACMLIFISSAQLSSLIIQMGFQWRIFGSKLNKLSSKQLLTMYLLKLWELSGHIHHGLQPKSADISGAMIDWWPLQRRAAKKLTVNASARLEMKLIAL